MLRKPILLDRSQTTFDRTMPMHRSRLSFGFALVILALPACAAAPEAPPAQAADGATDRAAILQQVQRWEDAIAARDVDFIADLYTPEGQLMPPGMPSAVGRDAVRQAFTGVLSPPNVSLTFGDDPVITISEAGDMAHEIGTYRYAFDGPQGPVVDEGKYLVVWEKRDGEWKVAADMFNTNLPAQ